MGSGFFLYTTSPDPLREALLAICGKEPPDFVRGHGISGLSDQQVSALQDWCSLNARPEWATGLGVLEAAELIVSQAVDNANIAPDPVPRAVPGPVPEEAGSHCSDCGRPRSPVDRCSAESMDDDGECPYLTIERLRAELARVSSAAAPVPGDMTTTKREFIAAGDYVPLKTKFGPVMVLPTDGEHFNVEVRDHNFLIDGVHFCFAFTVEFTPSWTALVGRLTEWSSGGTLTQRRKDLLLLEVLKCVADAARGPMASALVEAQKRVLNNNILSCEKDVEEARKKLAGLVAVLGSLLDEEASLSVQDVAV